MTAGLPPSQPMPSEGSLAVPGDVLLSAFEQSVHFAVLIDSRGTVVAVNQAALQLGGLTAENVIGRRLWEAGWWPRGDRARALLPRVIVAAAGGTPSRETVTIVGPRGALDLDVSIIPVRDPEGAIGLLFAEGRDVTASFRAERALRFSEAKFTGIVGISADAIISIDEDQNIIHFNTGAEQIFGWTEAEAIGQKLDMLLPERYRSAHAEHIRRFAASPIAARRMGERQEISGLRRSGEEFPADASISKIDVEGQRVFTVVLRDITLRKSAERAQAFLARAGGVLASSLDYQTTLRAVVRLTVPDLADWSVLYTLESDGTVRRLQAAHAVPARDELLQALVGRPLDRTGWHPAFEALDRREPALVSYISDDALRTMGSDPSQLELFRELGMRSALAVPLVARGELIGAMGFYSAVGGRFQDGDVSLAQDLALRAALAVDNARLYSEARSALRARDEVLDVVSHDLGNPLSAIRIGTSLLLKSLTDEEKSRGGWTHIESIRQSAAQMERLIKDLVEVKRMEAGQLPLARTRSRVSSILSQAFELFHGLAADRGLRLELRSSEETVTVHADRDRILQVLSNLVGNAIKFTPPGGHVTLSASAGDVEVTFAVSDTGPGLPAEHAPRVFDRFWQANRASGQGIGLGLAIAKAIVTAHGGRIWVESTPGEGATFAFTLPSATNDENATGAAVDGAARGGRSS